MFLLHVYWVVVTCHLWPYPRDSSWQNSLHFEFSSSHAKKKHVHWRSHTGKWILWPLSDTHHFSAQKCLQKFWFTIASHRVPLNHKVVRKNSSDKSTRNTWWSAMTTTTEIHKLHSCHMLKQKVTYEITLKYLISRIRTEAQKETSD